MSIQHISQPLAKELRHCLASAIASFKAYDVAGVCKRIGLPENDELDPFNSKYKYAMACIIASPIDVALKAAWQLLSEEHDFNLSEAAHRANEFGKPSITELTRRRIIAAFDDGALCTEIEVIDLLGRIWPIARMPSSDIYFDRTLADDIIRHTVDNDDWSNRELLEKVGAVECSQSIFFKFLGLVTDPLVQLPDRQAVLVKRINKHLAHDGFALAQDKITSGSPSYVVREAPRGAPDDLHISAVLKAFDPDDVHARWQAVMESRDSNPERTITLARTLLEDVCKWIIVQASQTYEEDADLPVLYKQLSKILKLAPDDHTEQIFKQILGGCHSIVHGLGSLRNKLGDAHSIGPIRARPSARHAALAGNLAGTMATFLVSTWRTRQDEAAKAKMP